MPQVLNRGHIMAACAAMFCILPVRPTIADNANPHPNIVLIFADDMGYGEVHALNPERGKIPTPNLDKLASQGMTFTDAAGWHWRYSERWHNRPVTTSLHLSRATSVRAVPLASCQCLPTG